MDLDNKKIAFIVHNIDKNKCEKVQKYLCELSLPIGYKVEIYISNEKNIAKAYNMLMLKSNAKYKIYINERIRITNQNFLVDIIKIFKMNWSIGIIGNTGAKILPTSGITTSAKNRVGKAIIDGQLIDWNNINHKYEKVQATDGYIMATQYDITWQQDFSSKGFLETAHCIEFMRQGYISVIPQQTTAWIILDVPVVNYSRCDQKIFLEKYSKDIFPLVSILITTYNRPQYFMQALESALQQSYKNIEIIIGDDSNNDDTKKLVELYQQKYDNIFYKKNTRRYSTVSERSYANYSSVLHRSKGRYINYLNDDDLFHPDKINIMMNYFIEYPNIALVTSHREFIDKDGKAQEFIGYNSIKVEMDTIIDSKTMIRDLLLGTDNYIGEPTTVLMRRCDIDGNFGTFFGTSFDCINDMAQWLESLKYGDLVYIKDTLSYMRIHDEQKTKDSFIWFVFKNDLFKFYTLSFAYSFGFRNKGEFIDMIKMWLFISDLSKFPADILEQVKNRTYSLFYDLNIIDEFLENYHQAEEIIKE